MTLYPLPIHPWPVTDADLSLIKAAKAQLVTTKLVTPVEAFPGEPVRILALRVAPEFLCDYALVREPENPVALRTALNWVLDETLDDPRATLILDQLVAIFGVGTREVFDEGVRFE